MDESFESKIKKLDRLDLERDEAIKIREIAEAKAAASEAKRLYGKDWKKVLFGAVKSLRVNKENLQTLHSMGVGDNSLRELNDPRSFRRK